MTPPARPLPSLECVDAPAVALSDLPLRAEARIVAVDASAGTGADLPERLAEIGFLPGEHVRVLARALFGEPLAVRVGSGTFALRLAEAACVRVVPLAAADRPGRA